jgi:hypothetical protein
MIAGFEKPGQVRAVLEALAHERKNHIYSPRHLAEIEAQEAIFKAELERMVAEGVEDEPVEGRGKGRSTLIRNNTTGRTYTEWIN